MVNGSKLFHITIVANNNDSLVNYFLLHVLYLVPKIFYLKNNKLLHAARNAIDSYINVSHVLIFRYTTKNCIFYDIHSVNFTNSAKKYIFPQQLKKVKEFPHIFLFQT